MVFNCWIPSLYDCDRSNILSTNKVKNIFHAFQNQWKVVSLVSKDAIKLTKHTQKQLLRLLAIKSHTNSASYKSSSSTAPRKQNKISRHLYFTFIKIWQGPWQSSNRMVLLYQDIGIPKDQLMVSRKKKDRIALFSQKSLK